MTEDRFEDVERIINLTMNGDFLELSRPNGVMENFAKRIKESTTKLRSIYNLILKSQRGNTEDVVKSFVLIYPRVKYDRGRGEIKDEIPRLFELFIKKIEHLENTERIKKIENFKKMFEILVSFHRSCGRK